MHTCRTKRNDHAVEQGVACKSEGDGAETDTAEMTFQNSYSKLRVQLSVSILLLLYPCILQNCYKGKKTKQITTLATNSSVKSQSMELYCIIAAMYVTECIKFLYN